jgi:hydrogenase expression/formation protein HypC
VCVGIPMRVVQPIAGGAFCDCEGRGRAERLDTMLVGEQPAGTWVLASRGVAVRVLTVDEAAQVNAALDALESALAGDRDFDPYFADLIAREPSFRVPSEGAK